MSAIQQLIDDSLPPSFLRPHLTGSYDPKLGNITVEYRMKRHAYITPEALNTIPNTLVPYIFKENVCIMEREILELYTTWCESQINVSSIICGASMISDNRIPDGICIANPKTIHAMIMAVLK